MLNDKSEQFGTRRWSREHESKPWYVYGLSEEDGRIFWKGGEASQRNVDNKSWRGRGDVMSDEMSVYDDG